MQHDFAIAVPFTRTSTRRCIRINPNSQYNHLVLPALNDTFQIQKEKLCFVYAERKSKRAVGAVGTSGRPLKETSDKRRNNNGLMFMLCLMTLLAQRRLTHHKEPEEKRKKRIQ